jgi:hypothetical protein
MPSAIPPTFTFENRNFLSSVLLDRDPLCTENCALRPSGHKWAKDTHLVSGCGIPRRGDSRATPALVDWPSL